MEYRTKCEGRYRRETESETHRQRSGSSVAKHRSLHSPKTGARLTGDRTRYTEEVAYDYTNVYGWNLKGKQKGC